MIKITNAVVGEGRFGYYFYGDQFDDDDNCDYWHSVGYKTYPVYLKKDDYEEVYDFNSVSNDKYEI